MLFALPAASPLIPPPPSLRCRYGFRYRLGCWPRRTYGHCSIAARKFRRSHPRSLRRSGEDGRPKVRPTPQANPYPRTQGQASKRPDAPTQARDHPQAGCRGYRGSPPVPKNVGGWAGGTTAHAKPDPPLIEGARQDKTIVPIAGGRRSREAPATPPLQNTNECAIVPP